MNNLSTLRSSYSNSASAIPLLECWERGKEAHRIHVQIREDGIDMVRILGIDYGKLKGQFDSVVEAFSNEELSRKQVFRALVPALYHVASKVDDLDNIVEPLRGTLVDTFEYLMSVDAPIMWRDHGSLISFFEMGVRENEDIG